MSVAYWGNRPVRAMGWDGRDVKALAMGSVKFWEKLSGVDGYQLQSIHLSNGAYFDTGYYPVPNATDTHCWMAMANNTETTRGVFGVRNFGVNADVFWNVSGSQKLRADLLGGLLSSQTIEIGKMIEFHNYSQLNKAIVDSEEIVGTATLSDVRMVGAYLIGSFTDGSVTPFAKCEMDIGQQWNITEWVDGVEVPQRSYVPWFRTSDNAACLRDTLTGEYLDAVTGTVTAGEPVGTMVTDEYVFASATDYDEPWIPSKYYFISSWYVGKPYTGEPTFNSMNIFAILALEFSSGDTISIYGLGGSGSSRLYGIANTDTNVITAVASAGVDTRNEPFTFTPDYNGVAYISIAVGATGGKVVYTHKP